MIADISWIDDFVRSISEYVYAREKDSLLILLPNQAYKLNRTGLVLLKRTLGGESIADVLGPSLCRNEEVTQQANDFFCDIRALVMGCLGEGRGRRAVEEVPFERPHNALPVLSEIALTYRCNLSCRFCYAGCSCRKSETRDREMSTAQVMRVLDVIRNDAEVPSVSWTGGEPTLREDLVDLTAYATELGMRVNLITNGTILNDGLVARLASRGLRSAQVSLEAPNAETHDALTQVRGSFDRTIDGIRLLKDAGLHVHTNTTVNRVNAPHIRGIVDLVAELGLTRFSMNMVIPCGSAPEDVTLSYTEMADYTETARQAAREAGVEFLWYSPTPYCIYNPVASRLGGKSCAACDGLLSVAPNGDVLPCSSLPKSVGNLLATPFDKVWNGRKALYWRRKRYAHKICRRCDLFDLCTGACPIYWRAKGYAELVQRRKSAAEEPREESLAGVNGGSQR